MPIPPGLNNHVELVYRPGERKLTQRLFELLGREVVDNGSAWLRVDGLKLFASEVTPEQWAFEQRLGEMLKSAASDPAVATYLAALKRAPQHYCHFGIGVATMAEWEMLVERVRTASKDDPELRGRVEVASVFRPGDPGSYGDSFVQAFIRTDVFSSGLLSMGQTFELQHYFCYEEAHPVAGP